METQNAVVDLHDPKMQQDVKPKQTTQSDIMTASLVSVTSSLSSPIDSGIQMLDSESELTSVMSSSCDIDNLPTLEQEELEENKKDEQTEKKDNIEKDEQMLAKVEGRTPFTKSVETLQVDSLFPKAADDDSKLTKERNVMTKSDIANQNVTQVDISSYSTSAPTTEFLNTYMASAKQYEEENKEAKVEESKENNVTKPDTETDLMNVSLNSYELLDYTLQNIKLTTEPTEGDQMHVSLSEEVNESLKLLTDTSNLETVQEINNVEEIQVVKDIPQDEQIVFRRQRKKKNKSDTPKKRVSFHEDILNSTKIDDIHINHGFITHEPDVSMSFFQMGFIRKPDVVKGRYSWAAEGDAPYYEDTKPHRDVKSDIYVHSARYSSTSSSSSASITSSIDEEDNSDEGVVKKQPSLGQPKSSCLKKTKHSKKYIDTNIVEEDINQRKKRSETNLLDTNIFGSLKSILNFSTSAPILAERGVPEGQEDITVYSSCNDLTYSTSRRSSVANLIPKSIETFEVTPASVKKVDPLELAKNNMKLTKSEGFYPNYSNQPVPANVIVCDSNVYEHTGISYSYEYDNFKKTFEQEKPKSSTIYQRILKEFNFFKRKATQQSDDKNEDFEFLDTSPNNETIEMRVEDLKEEEPKSHSSTISKYASSTRMDWSDNDTVSDFTELSSSTRHLNSPKHKIHKHNHYSLQSFKMDSVDKSDFLEVGSSGSKSQGPPRNSSKNSLINRFLRNVTLKKTLDMKLQRKQKSVRKYLGLYPKDLKLEFPVSNELDQQLDDEIVRGKGLVKNKEVEYDRSVLYKLKKEVFRNQQEELIRVSFFVLNNSFTNGAHMHLNYYVIIMSVKFDIFMYLKKKLFKWNC